MERTTDEARLKKKFKKKSGIAINLELYINRKSDSTMARRNLGSGYLYKKD